MNGVTDDRRATVRMDAEDGKANDAAPGVADAKVARGLNYMKKGDDPAIGSDDAYPQWLHDVLTPRENLGEYERRAAKAKAEGKDWRETFTADDAKRYTKLMRVAKMKANNAERAKK